MERCVQQDPDNAEYVNELGFQLLLQGKVKDAMKCYKNAMKLDETSVAALTGINDTEHKSLFRSSWNTLNIFCALY